MPARRSPKKSCWSKLFSSLPAAPLPRTDVQWLFFALALTLATCVALSPSANLRSDLVFAVPTRADLLLPARNPLCALGPRLSPRRAGPPRRPCPASLRGRRRGAVRALCPEFPAAQRRGRGVSRGRQRGALLREPWRDYGVSAVRASAGASEVVCAEEYVDFAEKARPSQGFLSYAHVEDGYRRVRRAARNPGEACLAQHAVEILEATWKP